MKLTDFLILNALLGSGGKKQDTAPKDSEPCSTGCLIIFVVGMLYCVYGIFVDEIWPFLVCFFPWDLYVCLFMVGVIVLSICVADANEKRRIKKFMEDFRAWEAWKRSKGDSTMYCMGCRGMRTVSVRTPHPEVGLQAYPVSCPWCNGSGIRTELPSKEFIDNFTKWEAARRAAGDHVKYCIYCRGRKIVSVEKALVHPDERERLLREDKMNGIDPITWEYEIPRHCLHCHGTGTRP